MDDLTLRDRLDTFTAAATAFCETLERHAALGADALLPQVHAGLVGLYAAVLALPGRDAFMNAGEPVEGFGAPSVCPDPAPPLVTHDAQRALATSLAHTLGARDAFHDVVAPLDDGTTVPASLAQELTLVHRDVRASMHAIATQGLAFGLWHARTFFESHWNAQLGACLRALEAHARERGAAGWPHAS